MPMYVIDVTRPPTHFDELHRDLWNCTVAFPTFDKSDSSFEELRSALESHVVYCALTNRIAAMRNNGEEPDRRLELARDAARRPFARILKMIAK
jgi:hypothetical protein